MQGADEQKNHSPKTELLPFKPNGNSAGHAPAIGNAPPSFGKSSRTVIAALLVNSPAGIVDVDDIVQFHEVVVLQNLQDAGDNRDSNNRWHRIRA